VEAVVVGFCAEPARMVGPEPASMLLIVFWSSAICSVHGPAHEGPSPKANRTLEASSRCCLLVIRFLLISVLRLPFGTVGFVKRPEAKNAALLPLPA
jgi:hypothetical protein